MPHERITFKNIRLRFRYTAAFLERDFDFAKQRNMELVYS
jgi:hypothetical protein